MYPELALCYVAVRGRHALRPLARRPLRLNQIVGRVNETHVRKSLWEIADETPSYGIILFGEEAKIVADRQKAFEQARRIVEAAEHDISVGKPKRAGKERTFLATHAVIDRLCRIPTDEAIPK